MGTRYLRGHDICGDRISVRTRQCRVPTHPERSPKSPIRPRNPPHRWGALQSKIDRLSTQPQRVLNLLM
ncbi:hypothetical protein [Microcoleus sp. SVA1B1]|uniref:hypothetical protein n=1 Tax=Microcoleus sp. SVA1B1 TaxID=3055422 RepID=UPI002FCFA905